MNFLRIIPSLLLSNKKLVKGVCFKNHKNAGSPKTTTMAFENQGADEISIIDIDCYSNNIEPDYEVLNEISQFSKTPITFGGGIKNLDIAKKIVRAGAEKIYINRAALNNNELIKNLVKTFGGQAIVVGINIIKDMDFYKIYEDINNQYNLEKYILDVQKLGVGEIKIMFVDREGKKIGIDLNYCNIINKIIYVSSIFEGGIGTLSHIEDAFNTKINALSLGTMLIFNDYNIVKIKSHLYNKGYNVRL